MHKSQIRKKGMCVCVCVTHIISHQHHSKTHATDTRVATSIHKHVLRFDVSVNEATSIKCVSVCVRVCVCVYGLVTERQETRANEKQNNERNSCMKRSPSNISATRARRVLPSMLSSRTKLSSVFSLCRERKKERGRHRKISEWDKRWTCDCGG